MDRAKIYLLGGQFDENFLVTGGAAYRSNFVSDAEQV
jgi:hypothetical protein